MPYYKFNEDDVFFNRIKAHPSCHFFSWKGCTYYNNQYAISGAFNSPIGHAGHTISGYWGENALGYGSYTSSCNSGYINLYEMNIDRYEPHHTLNTSKIQDPLDWGLSGRQRTAAGDADAASSLIFPFMAKDGTQNALKSITYDSYVEDFAAGDTITGSYPLTASVTRIFYEEGSSQRGNEVDPNPHENDDKGNITKYYYQNKAQIGKMVKDPSNPTKELAITGSKLEKKYIQMLENTINFYRKWSPHFVYSSSHDPLTGEDLSGGKDSDGAVNSAWDKSYQALSIIDVPSIFFGSSIKKGTVNLKYYITGTLVGELKDPKRNGELIQVGPSGSFKSGSVAGIVLYNEGALILTGAWDLTSRASFACVEGCGRSGTETGKYGPPLTQDYRHFTSADSPSWIYFGTGMNDGYPKDWDALQGGYTLNKGSSYQTITTRNILSSSYELEFSGTTYIPTITMMAHAKKGYLNWSNNPTYLDFSQSVPPMTGSSFYKENDIKTIKNTISSSFESGFTGSFKKQTFINKIGIYDKDRNLIAIAKVATPVRKLETDEYTFKLKLDI
jgi:hypothetical protein